MKIYLRNRVDGVCHRFYAKLIFHWLLSRFSRCDKIQQRNLTLEIYDKTVINNICTYLTIAKCGNGFAKTDSLQWRGQTVDKAPLSKKQQYVHAISTQLYTYTYISIVLIFKLISYN